MGNYENAWDARRTNKRKSEHEKLKRALTRFCRRKKQNIFFLRISFVSGRGLHSVEFPTRQKIGRFICVWKYHAMLQKRGYHLFLAGYAYTQWNLNEQSSGGPHFENSIHLKSYNWSLPQPFCFCLYHTSRASIRNITVYFANIPGNK